LSSETRNQASKSKRILEKESGDEMWISAEEEVDVSALVKELLELIHLGLVGRREEQLRHFDVL